MKRAVVTGAAGFIGSHLCDALLAASIEVTGIDSFTSYYDPSLKRRNIEPALAAGLVLHDRDLARGSLDQILRGADVVFHLAGQPGVRPSFGSSFRLYADRNLVATQRLLESVTRVGVDRLVFASSSSVYGSDTLRAASESDVRAPRSPYGLTKAACEDLIALYRRTAGLSATSLRYFTVYGPRQRPEMAFATFIRAIASGTPIRVYGDGDQRRDFSYVSDVVGATITAVAHGTDPVYNLSGESPVTLRAAIELIEQLTGRRARIDHRPDMRGDARYTAADLSAARRDLGYVPATRLVDGLAHQIAATKSSLARAA